VRWVNIPRNGKHALIAYDDLFQAGCGLSQMSCCFRRPPDAKRIRATFSIFTHACSSATAKLNEANGGGSLTALPVIETPGHDVSAYIPTTRDFDTEPVRSSLNRIVLPVSGRRERWSVGSRVDSASPGPSDEAGCRFDQGRACRVPRMRICPFGSDLDACDAASDSTVLCAIDRHAQARAAVLRR